MSTSSPRTFRELVAQRKARAAWGECRCCKQYKAVLKYSVRASICLTCAEKRGDEIMPAVAKHEAFQRRLEAIRQSKAERGDA